MGDMAVRGGHGWVQHDNLILVFTMPIPFLWNERHGSGSLPLHRSPSFPFAPSIVVTLVVFIHFGKEVVQIKC
jgi:hypothetical protein